MSSSEADARRLLLDMQNRLAAGPHAALGIPSHATAADIRSAFLQLTKQFHPARFGRMATEIQKLSNEVFLSLRAAHDLLARPTSPSKPSGRTGSITANPTNVATSSPAKGATRPFGVPVPPTTPARPITRAPVEPAPSSARQTQPIARPVAPGANRQTQPLPTTARTSPTPAQAPSRPTPPTTQPSQPTQPTQMSVRAAASPGRGGTIRFPTAARASGPTPGTQATTPAVAPRGGSSASGAALDPELALILQLMGMGQWDAAQAAIDALASKNPQNKRYAALACYSRGRRAQLEGKIRDAQIELQQALQLDPDLDVAKTAVAELYARRK